MGVEFYQLSLHLNQHVEDEQTDHGADRARRPAKYRSCIVRDHGELCKGFIRGMCVSFNRSSQWLISDENLRMARSAR